ncbi:MAG: hypothetical protein JXM79_05260 [Sedimentisphaerales bacterium]|nr:hypothetical protein [Sedimentisphaerales bacterium]
MKDKVALVTSSAGREMGRSIALTFAREEAKVSVNYRTSQDQAQALVKHIENLSEAVEQCEHGPAWLKRINTSPQNIAESVAFLCSDAGGFITGGVLPFLFYS